MGVLLLHVPNKTMLVLVGPVLRAQGAGESPGLSVLLHVFHLLSRNDVRATRKVVVSVEINLGGVSTNKV